MPSTLANFQLGDTTNIQSDDFVVGYDTAVLGGERRWTVSTLANAVSGLIKTEMANFMNNTLTLGNYPYLEYAWVTAPNTNCQTLTNQVSSTLTLNTEVADTGNFGSINSNQLSLSAGSYQYEITTNLFCYNGRFSSIISLLNSTTKQFISRRSGVTNTDAGRTQFTLAGRLTHTNESHKYEITAMASTFYGESIYVGPYYQAADAPNSIFNNQNALADQRTTIRLWKVG